MVSEWALFRLLPLEKVQMLELETGEEAGSEMEPVDRRHRQKDQGIKEDARLS